MKKILFFLILIMLVNVKASIQGDINLDGKVSAVDYIMVKNHIIGVNKLKGNNLTMADVNNDKKVNALDYISIINIMINKNQIKEVTAVIIDKTSASIEIGESITLKGQVSPSDATNKTLTWTSSNNKIASVDKNGKVTGVSNGEATITVKSNNGKTTTCKITVNSDNSVYDVVLFWGQSNMVGANGKSGSEYDVYDSRLKMSTCERPDLNNFYDKDGPLCKESYSILSGIQLDILNNYTTIRHVNVNLVKDTVYMYNYFSNNITPLTGNEDSIGENVYAILDSNNNFIKYTNSNKNSIHVSERSLGTNLIPYFGKTYYENTGHKLVIVFVASGARLIEEFLPHNDTYLKNTVFDSKDNNINTIKKNRYAYELMVEEYKNAINYLKKSGKKIGNQFHVSFQGEANSNYEEYKVLYKRVHNYLKNALNLKFGVLIETSRYMPYDTSGNYTPYSKKEVLKMYDSQNALITYNNDIILGSDFSFRHYVPSKDLYCEKKCRIENCNVNECNSKLTDAEYKKAYKAGLLTRSIVLSKNVFINNIHFTSAALSQIGYEAAINASNYIKNNYK